ncbi:hypothetical protein Hanom_Chr17g01531941 [Helianthus anomalus]
MQGGTGKMISPHGSRPRYRSRPAPSESETTVTKYRYPSPQTCKKICVKSTDLQVK